MKSKVSESVSKSIINLITVLYQTVSGTQHQPPVIEEPPVNTNASLISSINLTCTAEVSSAPSYQWLKDGVSIAGEMKAFLYIEVIGPEDRGNYTCVAINGGGRDESEPARLRIPGI